jgi:hypothetical protein
MAAEAEPVASGEYHANGVDGLSMTPTRSVRPSTTGGVSREPRPHHRDIRHAPQPPVLRNDGMAADISAVDFSHNSVREVPSLTQVRENRGLKCVTSSPPR